MVAALCAIASNVVPSAGVSAEATYGTNLVVNGDAEAGPGAASSSEIKPPPGWTSTGQFTAVKYGASGGFPDATSPSPADRGANFFAGGNVVLSSGSQTIRLDALAADIDTGTVKYAFSAWLGGFSNQDDNATVTVTFRSKTGGNTGHAQLGPVLSAERKAVTGFLSKQAVGTVPKGTRSAVVTITCRRLAGTYNDGEADDVSLILDKAP